MYIYRLKKNGDVLILGLDHTNIGINKKIENYIGKKGKIKESHKNSLNGNNARVEMEDGFSFWISHLDLQDIQIGINLNYTEIISLIPATHKSKNRLIHDIFYDFLKGSKEKDISNKYNIDIFLIAEIFFLFEEN